MSEEKNSRLRLIIVFTLSIIASILIIIFTIPKAQALVMVYPNENKTINNVTYYGYNIPTRPNPTEFGTGLQLGIESRLYDGAFVNDFSFVANNKYPFYKSNNFHFDLLDQYITDNNISLEDISYNMTNPIFVKGPNSPTLYKYTWTFNLGNSSSTSDMLSSGQYFDYKQYYSFEYDIVLFDSNTTRGHLGESINLSSSPQVPAQSTNYNGFLAGNNLSYSNICVCDQSSNYWSCPIGNNGYGYQTTIKYQDKHLQVLHVKVLFNEYSKFRFSESLEHSNTDNGFTKFKGINITNNDEVLSVNYFHDVNTSVLNFSDDGLNIAPIYLFVSMPYNITMWTTEPSEFCQGSQCWNQEDTDSLDNNKNSLSSDSFLDDILTGLNNIITRDYGFSGIVNFTFNFINDLLLTMKNSDTCYVTSVSFFGKQIVLPCGRDFWNRNDMNVFNTTYNLIFIGALSYILCWKIYKDLLNVLNPKSRIINGSEVDSL